MPLHTPAFMTSTIGPFWQAWEASQVPLTEHICGVRLRTRACSVHLPNLANTHVLVLPLDEEPAASYTLQPSSDWKLAKSLMDPPRHAGPPRSPARPNDAALLVRAPTAPPPPPSPLPPLTGT